MGTIYNDQCPHPQITPIYTQFLPNLKWTILRSHRSYGQKWGTKRSARRCSFKWYHRRPSNSNRATNARRCSADDGIFLVSVFRCRLRLVDIMKYLKNVGYDSKGMDTVWRRVAWRSGGYWTCICARRRQRQSWFRRRK